MNNFIKLIVILILFNNSVASQAASTASFLRGNQLLNLCESSFDVEQWACQGYVMGVNDAMYSGFLDNTFQVCVPPGVSPEQLKLVVVNYMKTIPQKLHFIADGIVAESLAVTFGCSEVPNMIDTKNDTN